jgi:DNA mismatch repair protein MSH6
MTSRDKKKRRPDDPNYDPSTVFIPQELFKKLTPGMQQYWEVKKDHFDSVVLVRFGKWYFLYYYDIVALNEVTDTPINLNYQMHGFHSSDLETYVKRFVDKGYRVVVVEQTETTNMMLERLENRDKSEKLVYIVNREIHNIYTRGTYRKIDEKFVVNKQLEHNEDALDQSHVLVYVYDQEENAFGFTFFDLSTLQFYIGQFTDDSMLTKFRTLATRVRPVEVVCSSALKQADTTKMLKASPLPPAFTFLHPDFIKGRSDAEADIEHFLGSDGLPSWVSEALKDHSGSRLAVTALGNCITYLDTLLLAEKTVSLAEFQRYSHEHAGTTGSRLLIDAQAMRHLEMFEVESNNKLTNTGSLFSLLDNCKTKFGSRLLKSWLQAPLNDEKKLKERLNAIEWLVNDKKVIEEWKKEIKNIPDLEKWLARLYKFSIDSESKAIYVNINLVYRLNEFYLVITAFEEIVEKLQKIFKSKNVDKWRRLKSLW